MSPLRSHPRANTLTPRVGLIWIALACSFAMPARAVTNTVLLSYAPAPAANVLKGFVPYAGRYTNFPHSLEWFYLPLGAVMSGPTNFDWTPLESKLDAIAARGHQAVFRFYLDYPAQPSGIPQFLRDAGLQTRRYSEHSNHDRSLAPDYENALLRQALTQFIAALGARYDGDARIGFITVGLLGFWGEWHTHPHNDWFASVAVQDEVLAAYERAFTHTKLLVRRPAGSNPTTRRVGYHDDSFAFQTIDPPAWHFLGLLKTAGETGRWHTQPIGGEVRPEVQAGLWAEPSAAPAGQAFARCVQATHASWLLNQAVFAPGFSGAQLTNALAGARQLGYELFVSKAELMDATVSGPLRVSVTITNRGVAPFYYDWPVQLGVLDAKKVLVATWTTNWRLGDVMPETGEIVWSHTKTNHGLIAGPYRLLLRVENPLRNGLPLRFANATQDADHDGWLTLGGFSVTRER